MCSFPGCGKRCADRSALKRHELTHNTAKPYKCTFENFKKAYKSKSYLGEVLLIVFIVEIHMRLHTEEEPYRCKVKGCGRTFSSSKSLRRHEHLWHNMDGEEPTVEHQLRERILRLQTRHKVVVACWSDSQQRVGKLELKLKQAVAINRSLKKQRSEMRKYVKMTKKEM